MVTVMLCGSEKETDMVNVLLAAIHSVSSTALHVTAKTVSLLPPDAEQVEFIILDNANIHDLHMEKGIVLFKSEIAGFADYDLPPNFIAVVEPENDKAIEILKKNALQTVTCGLSQRDTLTFSSHVAERAVISLQREIKTLGGKAVLPHEIPVSLLSTYGDYQLLAATAVLMLSDVAIPEEGISL